jgi:hypothetical protein
VKIKSTIDPGSSFHKVFLYAHHGWGKTTQCRHLLNAYGKGLIISGESGLKSLSDVDIPYLEFRSWDQFKEIINLIDKTDLVKEGYRWLAVDSITEVSDRLIEHLESVHADSNNGFQMWTDYSRYMIGAMKWLRDRPMHVLMTSLAAEETDDNGRTHYWPLVKGAKVSKQIPGLYDHVWAGVRSTSGDASNPVIERYLITEEVHGWHGKSRDPRRRLKPVEKSSNVADLLLRIDMPEEAKKAAKAAGEKEDV